MVIFKVKSCSDVQPLTLGKCHYYAYHFVMMREYLQHSLDTTSTNEY